MSSGRIRNHIRSNAIAWLALFLALGGGSFAVAALNGSEKRVVKKIANQQISKREPGLEVKHAGSADELTCKAPVAGIGQMVKVGSFCIDKYEASVWSTPTGGTQYGVTGDDYPCSDDGQDCKGTIFARSVAGVTPSAYITWFQAQAALSNSGKRLPSNAEWQQAAQGTPDGNVAGACPSPPLPGPAITGDRASCVSDWGVNDMVRSVWEWVADWVPASTTPCPAWGSVGDFSSDDQMCLTGASTSALGPGALTRGGQWNSGNAAGPFAVNGLRLPQNSDSGIGFRGAR